jgi:hypothetical protein
MWLYGGSSSNELQLELEGQEPCIALPSGLIDQRCVPSSILLNNGTTKSIPMLIFSTEFDSLHSFHAKFGPSLR